MDDLTPQEMARVLSVLAWVKAQQVCRGAARWTGREAGMLQDDSRGLSRWLASTPDARRHAREAAAAIRTTHG